MLIAFVSAYLTVKSRFFQISHFKYILSETFFKIFDRPESSSKTSISPFQATTASLAGTVGMGNMAGVATALSIGGPGAIFWMWILALFGMITKAAEIAISVHYREIDQHGNIIGGPIVFSHRHYFSHILLEGLSMPVTTSVHILQPQSWPSLQCS